MNESGEGGRRSPEKTWPEKGQQLKEGRGLPESRVFTGLVTGTVKFAS